METPAANNSQPTPATLAHLKKLTPKEDEKPKKPFVRKEHLTQRIEGLEGLRESMRPKRQQRGRGKRR